MNSNCTKGSNHVQFYNRLIDILRISLSIVVVLLFSVFTLIPTIDIFEAILIVVLLLFDLLGYSRRLSSKSVIIYYVSWMLIAVGVVYEGQIGLYFWSPLVIIFTLKAGVLALSYLKFKRLYVTKTVLGYIWLTSFVLYLIELIINSTHGLGSLCVNLAFFSVVEHVLLILVQRKQRVFVPSVLSLAWKKSKND